MNFVSSLISGVVFSIFSQAQVEIPLSCRIYETETRYSDYNDSYTEFSGWICQKRACELSRKVSAFVGYRATSLDSNYYFHNVGTCNSSGVSVSDSVSGSLPGLN